ncbi:MAG: hypothetical protein HOO96_09565 [Polyangiaceae bacterium]|nr:hypothetical protein [Polyangiaceae bacterium]
MVSERRHTRSSNRWIALFHLFAQRAPAGAVLADDQGLPLVAVGMPDAEADVAAAELVRTNEPPIATALGLEVRLFVRALDAQAQRWLASDVARILAMP